MLKAKLKLLSTTKMIDYMQDIYESLSKQNLSDQKLEFTPDGNFRLLLIINVPCLQFSFFRFEFLYFVDLTRQREAVLKKFEELKSHTQPIVNILEQETVTEQLQNNRDKDSRQLLEFLTQTTDVCFSFNVLFK